MELEKIIKNPWDNVYWFSRMLINSDKYGGIGAETQTMINIAVSLRSILESKELEENDEQSDAIEDYGKKQNMLKVSHVVAQIRAFAEKAVRAGGEQDAENMCAVATLVTDIINVLTKDYALQPGVYIREHISKLVGHRNPGPIYSVISMLLPSMGNFAGMKSITHFIEHDGGEDESAYKCVICGASASQPNALEHKDGCPFPMLMLMTEDESQE